MPLQPTLEGLRQAGGGQHRSNEGVPGLDADSGPEREPGGTKPANGVTWPKWATTRTW